MILLAQARRFAQFAEQLEGDLLPCKERDALLFKLRAVAADVSSLPAPPRSRLNALQCSQPP